MKGKVIATDADSVLAAANEHLHETIHAHHAAGRSTYFGDAQGRVYEQTPEGRIFEVRNTEEGPKRIRLVKQAQAAIGGLAI